MCYVAFMIVLQLQSQCEFSLLLWLMSNGPVTDKNSLFSVVARQLSWVKKSEGKKKKKVNKAWDC